MMSLADCIDVVTDGDGVCEVDFGHIKYNISANDIAIDISTIISVS